MNQYSYPKPVAKNLDSFTKSAAYSESMWIENINIMEKKKTHSVKNVSF